MHAITQRAVVVGGKIEARPIMNVALTYDHRLIDGREVSVCVCGVCVCVCVYVRHFAPLCVGRRAISTGSRCSRAVLRT